MTDHTGAPEPSPSSGGRWRLPALVALLVIAIVVVVALVTSGGDDDPEPASDSTGNPTAPATTESAATDSPSASSSPSDNGDPVFSPIIDKAAKDAIADGFPAMVPAGVPAGWTVEKATYSPKRGGMWRIDLTDPDGDLVEVVQSKKTVDGIAHEYLGKDAEAAGRVNLGDYGTGTWGAWSSAKGAGVTKKISDTAVLVHGPDQDTAVEIAQLLLTAEDANGMSEG